jgi:uncharacterized protein DUF4350
VTPAVRAHIGRFSATSVAITLGVVALIVALLTPEQSGRSAGGLSSYSTAPGGAGIVYELAGRLGWRTERRITTLDSLRAAGDRRPTVQVVLAPRSDLGAHEIHDLLENVRRGGGLVLSLDGDDDLRDSLGLGYSAKISYLSIGIDSTCPRARLDAASMLSLPPEAEEVTRARHGPGRIDTLVLSYVRAARVVSAIGFSLGKGRVAVTGGSGLFSNQAVRVCRWGADVAAMRLFDYARPDGGEPAVLVFDEFHHGFGVHPSSTKAAASYLWHTRTGNLVLQLLAAGLLLLFALAPRPLVPRDDVRVVRRSPLEHAAALGRAYEDVHATRTATATLISGVRRRTRGIVPVPASAPNDEFLEAVARRLPSLEPQVAVVTRAGTQDTERDAMGAVGEALATIEAQLLSTPSTRS